MIVMDIDRGFSKMMAAFKEGAVKVQVGTDNELTADRMAYNEFGTSTAPSRPFFRSTMDENRLKYEKALQEGIFKKIFNFAGITKPKDLIAELGVMIQADVRAKIMSNMPPETAKPTGVTLIDTGAMLATLHMKVVKV